MVERSEGEGHLAHAVKGSTLVSKDSVFWRFAFLLFWTDLGASGEENVNQSVLWSVRTRFAWASEHQRTIDPSVILLPSEYKLVCLQVSSKTPLSPNESSL